MNTAIDQTGILWALLLFSSMILIHEFGHFLLAKMFNVKVKRFSLGFGPIVFKKLVGETEFAVSMIMLGGYVSMLGENPGEEVPEEEKARAYCNLAPWKRACIVGVGPLFNVLLAMVVMSIVYMHGTHAVYPIIGDVLPDSPAYSAGLQKGDVITAIGDRRITRWEECVKLIQESAGKRVPITIDRGGRKIRVEVVPVRRSIKDILHRVREVGSLGVRPEGKAFVAKETPDRAILLGIEKVFEMAALLLVAVAKLIDGTLPLSNIGGPIMIVKTIRDQVNLGLSNYLIAMAFLNVNVGILNLLPIPSFDGGHLLFLSIESVRKRPLPFKTMLTAQRIGISIVIVLMTIAVYNDVMKLAAK